MKVDTDARSKAVDDLKSHLLECKQKNGSERQLMRELCKQKLNELSAAMEMTRDDQEAIDSAIDKDEDLAIILIDRAMDFYRTE